VATGKTEPTLSRIPGDHRAGDCVQVNMNLHVANAFVIVATALQATGSDITSAPQVLDLAAHPEAYEIYATVLPRPWVQGKGPLLLQQETERVVGDPCGLLKNQTGEWADAAKDFEHQNARPWLLQAAFPNYFQYQFIRRAVIEAQDARVPGTYPGRAGLAPYVIVSAVGFNRDRTKAIVTVQQRLQGWVSRLELKDAKWEPATGEVCTWVA